MITVRFVVALEDERVKYLVLGHGYKDQGGEPHSWLAETYKVSTFGSKIYAGYISLHGSDVELSEGGSMSLNIRNNGELNKTLSVFFERRPGLYVSIIESVHKSCSHCAVAV